MMEQQMAGGAMPGQPMMAPGAAGPPPDGAAPGGPPAGQVMPPGAPGPGAPGPGAAPAGQVAASRDEKVHSFFAGLAGINGPAGSGPSGSPPTGGVGPELPPGVPEPTEVPRNRQRPAESDDNRKFMPSQTTAKRKRTRKGVEEEPRRLTKFETGPSSYGSHLKANQEHVENQVQRLEAISNWRMGGAAPSVSDLVNDPAFYRATNMQAYEGQIKADWPEILAGGAQESRSLVETMCDQFREIFGVDPQW